MIHQLFWHCQNHTVSLDDSLPSLHEQEYCLVSNHNEQYSVCEAKQQLTEYVSQAQVELTSSTSVENSGLRGSPNTSNTK